MITPLFTALSSQRIADLMRSARRRVCFAAPGIHEDEATVLAVLATRHPDIEVSVLLDFDERTLRMGYGSLAAVETIKAAGLQPYHVSGFRSGILIVDDDGWAYTPTALYLETEPTSEVTPNAIILTKDQVYEVVLRLSRVARERATAEANTDDEIARLHTLGMEVRDLPLDDGRFHQVKNAIEIAPPVKFDVVRQVRVFEPYLQYVELSLTGAAIQRHRVRIPKELQNLGTSKDLEGKLHTTFDLIESGSSMSSSALEYELNDIRKRFTASLGSDLGRVVLKRDKPLLMQRVAELRKKLKQHQFEVHAKLQHKLDESRREIEEYYLPLAKANPPEALLDRSVYPRLDDDVIRTWVTAMIGRVVPSAQELIQRMVLEDHYKDVTFETLNSPDFLHAVKKAFPNVDWDRPFNEFKAAAASQNS